MNDFLLILAVGISFAAILTAGSFIPESTANIISACVEKEGMQFVSGDCIPIE